MYTVVFIIVFFGDQGIDKAKHYPGTGAETLE